MEYGLERKSSLLAVWQARIMSRNTRRNASFLRARGWLVGLTLSDLELAPDLKIQRQHLSRLPPSHYRSPSSPSLSISFSLSLSLGTCEGLRRHLGLHLATKTPKGPFPLNRQPSQLFP